MLEGSKICRFNPRRASNFETSARPRTRAKKASGGSCGRTSVELHFQIPLTSSIAATTPGARLIRDGKSSQLVTQREGSYQLSCAVPSRLSND